MTRNGKQIFFTILSAVTILLCTGITSHGQGKEASHQSAGLYDRLHRFHGDTCAGSLMGVRLGLAARNAIVQAGGTPEKLQAIYYDLSCPVDGLQISVGTTLGNGTLIIKDMDKHRLLLTDLQSGYQAEASLTDIAMKQARASRKIRERIKALPKESQQRVALENELEDIFTWFRTAPDAEIVSVNVSQF